MSQTTNPQTSLTRRRLARKHLRTVALFWVWVGIYGVAGSSVVDFIAR